MPENSCVVGKVGQIVVSFHANSATRKKFDAEFNCNMCCVEATLLQWKRFEILLFGFIDKNHATINGATFHPTVVVGERTQQHFFGWDNGFLLSLPE